MNTILVTCKNEGCNSKFRIPEFQYGKNIKNNTDKQECKICKNKKILQNAKTRPNPTTTKRSKTSTSNKKPNQTRPKGKKQNINKALDNAWSKLVKLIWERKCAVCGNRKSLNSHHIYSRAKKSVCWDTVNGICLCVKHHIGVEFSAHKTPNDFTYWLEELKGKDWMMKLRFKANTTVHRHDFEKQIILDELNKRIKSYD